MSVQNPLPLDHLARALRARIREGSLNEEGRWTAMLPALEYPWPQGESELLLQLRAVEIIGADEEFSLSPLVAFALRSPTFYWVYMALRWLESGFPVSADVRSRLDEVSRRSDLEQAIRHKAYAILKNA